MSITVVLRYFSSNSAMAASCSQYRRSCAMEHIHDRKALTAINGGMAAGRYHQGAGADGVLRIVNGRPEEDRPKKTKIKAA
jgi:hypothetical protein